MGKLSGIQTKPRAGMFPKGSLEDKQNYKRLFRIARDGTVTECVLLRVLDDRLREQIIMTHFLSSWVRHVLREQVGVTLLGRDSPWDFAIELSDGDKFWLEITSICEDEDAFRRASAEERLDMHGSSPTLPLSMVRKLHHQFPNDRSAGILARADAEDAVGRDEVENPWFVQGERLFVGSAGPASAGLFDMVAAAVTSKAAKRHSGKEQTVLVIDNRTTSYDMDDLREAAKRFHELRQSCPFRSVWFYTGFFSDDDGGNAEWQLASILAPDDILNRMMAGKLPGG